MSSRVRAGSGAQNEDRPSVVAMLAAGLDRALPVPLGIQLSGLIQYGIALGDFTAGTRLPPVRDLAERAGIAPMTVVGVYNELKRQRLIETRGSAGTFVAETDHLPAKADFDRLQPAIDTLLDLGLEAGLGPTELATLLNARANHRRQPTAKGLRIVLVGHFAQATAAYADHIRPHLPPNDLLSWTTIADLAESESPPDADIVLTLQNRRIEVEAIFGAQIPVLGINFVPSGETAARLAGLAAEAHVGIVSVFPEFMALMKPGVVRFAPQIAGIEVVMADDPGLDGVLSRADVIVYATGLDRLTEKIRPDQQAFEYRYAPDVTFIKQHVLPRLDALRQAEITKENQ
ncbi:GntR family transcriptional regulator [Devosia sp. SD17-2]|uniref:GntR family transcriptional regulator n=1 Tax=Devosia sp. SD17-2 TaxID=2976459 RepID=UPI0023D8BD52|nr:GntR family transcriptional regulator [Devosia sp. SD17-2]WEJ31480.1 GntR family transcriptional regulator [Devosia sp. SD17-2]